MKDIIFNGWDPNVVLELWHVTKRFGGLTAVGDVSFKIKKGEIYALIGPNGAGKTTIFNLITGVYALKSKLSEPCDVTTPGIQV